jgi:hypothetical protein
MRKLSRRAPLGGASRRAGHSNRRIRRGPRLQELLARCGDNVDSPIRHNRTGSRKLWSCGSARAFEKGETVRDGPNRRLMIENKGRPARNLVHRISRKVGLGCRDGLGARSQVESASNAASDGGENRSCPKLADESGLDFLTLVSVGDGQRKTVWPIARYVGRPDVGIWRQAERHHARTRALPHAPDIRVVGIEDGDSAPRQIRDKPALFLRRRNQAAKFA